MPDNNNWVFLVLIILFFELWVIYRIRTTYVYAEICILLSFSRDVHLLNPFASSSKINQCASFVKQNL